MFENLKTDASIVEEKDTLGGGRTLYETDVYPAKITMAYGKKSDSGAMAVSLTFDLGNGREFSKDVYMTNKAGQNYYEREGEKHYLPGFNLVNSLCLLTTGQEISALTTETKTVKMYNKEAKADVPTPAPVLTELLGKEIHIAIEKVLDDKTVKNESTGKYEPTGETQEVNEIAKFFCARPDFDGMTQTEIKAARGGNAPAELFKDQWLKKNQGKVRNKAKGAAAGGAAGAPGNANTGANAAAKKPTNSLFG